MGVPKNPDLPTSFQVPGVYIFEARTGGQPDASNNRVLILGYRTSAGDSNRVGVPQQVNSESDVVTLAGTGSECHRIYRAFIAQMGGSNVGAEIWVCTMNAPSGTAQTRIIKLMAAPSAGVLGANTTASNAGIMSVWVCGYRVDVTVASGDAISVAPYTIAANLEAELLKIQDQLPCTVGRSNDTITLTARHTALSSADLPTIVSFSNTAMAVAASCGTLTYANTISNAAGGTSILGVTTQSVSTTLNGTAPGPAYDADACGAATVAAINAAVAFPVTAAQTAPSPAVTLFYANGRVVNWLTTSITPAATITTTLTPAFGASAAGLPSSSTPSLSTVLTNIAAQPAFKLWLTPFTGAGAAVTDAAVTQTGSVSDYTNMGTFCNQLETQGNGVNQKGQVMVYGDTRKLTVAGGLLTSTTPNLTTTPRFFPCWCNASPQQAYEISARCAADIITTMGISPAIPYHGHILKTGAAVPLLSQTSATRPSDSDCNAAMVTYYMTPIRDNGQGQLVIVSGRSSAKPSAAISGDYRWWPIQLLDDFVRDDMGAYLAPYLKDKSIKAIGEPVTPYTITAQAIRAQVLARIAFYNANDWFDGGAADFKDLCKAEINVALPSRIDVKMPKKFPIPLEQLGIVTEFAF